MEDNINELSVGNFGEMEDMVGIQADQHVVLYYEYLLQQGDNHLFQQEVIYYSNS